MPADAGSGEGHAEAKRDACHDQHPRDGPDVGVRGQPAGCGIGQKGAKDHDVQDAAHRQGAQEGVKRPGVFPLDQVPKDAKKAKAAPLHDDPKRGSNQERHRRLRAEAGDVVKPPGHSCDGCQEAGGQCDDRPVVPRLPSAPTPRGGRRAEECEDVGPGKAHEQACWFTGRPRPFRRGW